MKRQLDKPTTILGTALLLSLLPCAATFAHDHSAYSHDSGISHENADWMANVADQRRLADLSLPGTHDTMTYALNDDDYTATQGVITDVAMTQNKSLRQQLLAGVRVLDIRCRRTPYNNFDIYHGSIDTGFDFDDVLLDVTDFLADHPTETVLMRLKPEGNDGTMSFEDVLDTYVDDSRYASYFWKNSSSELATGSSNTRLGDVRGKIVVLANFSGERFGIDYASANIQDEYELDTNWDLYDKWVDVKEQFQASNTSTEGSRGFYINFLSGSGGSFPYFVASGHSSPGTSAPRLWTGLTTITSPNKYPDFPRLDCLFGECSIYFEGTNVLTYDYLDDANITFAGIVYSDFPGHGLIDRVIALNNDGVTLFNDPDYKGARKSFELGTYERFSQLSIGNDQLSSISIADGLMVTLYEHGLKAGASIVLTSDTPKLSTYNFDNRVSSMVVSVQGAAVYEHSDYTGRMQILRPGSYNLSDLNLDNDSISSLRVGSGYRITLHEHSNFGGDDRTYTADASSLGGFNDDASSIEVSVQ
ncbi:MAG TPA: phosphatidylinositol-specific phospholipase C domain-containing protein [Tahibacter sp.]|uniref:phosphatidylinositol-specific phospholipase C domain-containing protein n=1 Tax=Tahibacter sp. TaxID=2056211 RepID=UPI002CC13132|nr:phosphatidylinositol-specific phospholipase C domain-containing protein [Tahibacter sp.]HSX62283.1 phosphatidylinositol-specific phospholipase C domain-containing protein [Tahibacter sp.]